MSEKREGEVAFLTNVQTRHPPPLISFLSRVKKSNCIAAGRHQSVDQGVVAHTNHHPQLLLLHSNYTESYTGLRATMIARNNQSQHYHGCKSPTASNSLPFPFVSFLYTVGRQEARRSINQIKPLQLLIYCFEIPSTQNQVPIIMLPQYYCMCKLKSQAGITILLMATWTLRAQSCSVLRF